MALGTSNGNADDLLGEAELRQISRSIRSYIPHETPQDGEEHQLDQFRQLLDRCFLTSGLPSLEAAHRVAAWNTLCSLIDQAVGSQSRAVQEHIWSSGVWSRGFQLYLIHAQSARPKSSRQLMSTLANALCKAPEDQGREYKALAAKELVSCLRDYGSPSRAKAGAQLLSHLLAKDVLSIDAVSTSHGHTFSSITKRPAADVPLEAVLETTFRWLAKGDFGSTVAQLAATLLDKSAQAQAHRKPDVDCAKHVPIWIQPLKRAVVADALDANALRAHILPVLFKRDWNDAISFLYMQGLMSMVLQRGNYQSTSDHNRSLLLVALQTCKEIGLLQETDGSQIWNDGKSLHIPVAALGRLLLRSDRAARTTGLNLLVTSTTTTKPFSTTVLALIRNALRIFVADTDADFRSDIFSAVQKLVDRIRAITAASARQQSAAAKTAESTSSAPSPATVLASHKGFLEWLIRSLQQDLRPTASYQRHISALQCLYILAKSGLDDSVPRNKWSRTALGETRWPFNLPIMTPALQYLLLDLVIDPFDDVRQTAASTLFLFSSHLQLGLRGLGSSGMGLLRRAENIMLKTSRADHADGVAHLYAIYGRTQKDDTIPDEEDMLGPGIVPTLVKKLDEMIAIAREDLAEAVARYPMHGVLTSIRYILHSETLDSLSLGDCGLLDRLKEIWLIVKPVLCNDAPEGYQPEQIDLSGDSTKETLSFCWRALKEASLLLNVMINKYQDLEQVEDMSNLCFTQLAELRHRGAFSTVAQTWASCCAQCAEFEAASGERLLDRWYERVLDMLRRNITINTRRSAGLPSLLCGILIAQKSGASFDQAFRDLEFISRMDVDTALAEEGNLPQVHAMNCIKDVLKNTKLGERSERYVPAALQLAVDALQSEAWAIRNCGLMLFRAVIDRLLGTDQSHLEESATLQKHISAEQYSELLDVILGLLPTNAKETSASSGRNEGVFPSLRLLQHTRIPTARLSDVTTAVMTLTGSPSWHVRDKAAKAMAALLSLDEPLTATNEYQTITQDPVSRRNEVHGMLLTACYLMRKLRREYDPTSSGADIYQQFSQVECRSIMRYALLELSNDDCHITRATAVDVVREYKALLYAFEPAKDHSDAHGLPRFDTYAMILTATAGDPSAAILRQAVVRCIAQQVAHGEIESPGEEDDILAMLLQTVKIDQNALEHFFHALDDDKLPIAGSAVPLLAELATKILNDELDIVVKCVAQEALLKLTSVDKQVLSTTGPTNELLQAASCNQRYADNHLQLQAVFLESAASHDHDLDASALTRILGWSADCVRAINEEGIYTREAAAAAIDRIEVLWSVMGKTEKLQGTFLTLCIAVYDLLNDDDEDIRLLASRLTTRILSTASTEIVPTYEPIIAGQKLLGFCVSRWSKDSTLAQTAFERAFGENYSPVAEQLAAISRSETALFAQEKQNLYVDDALEVRVWSKLIQKLSAQALTPDTLLKLSTWIMDGLRALKRHAQRNSDGPLGWTSKAEIFTLGLRVIYGAESLFALVQKTGRLPVQPSALRMAVFETLTAFEAADVTPLWLWEIQRVLSESVTSKTRLMAGMAASSVNEPVL